MASDISQTKQVLENLLAPSAKQKKKTGNKTTSRTIEGELMEGEMQKNAETRKLISIAGGRKEQLDGNARRDQS